MDNLVLGIVAATRVAVGGGGTPGDLQSRIGEHYYYCPGKGIGCHPNLTSFVGNEINLDTIFWTLVAMVFIVVVAFIMRLRLSLERPRGLQNVLETAFEFINNFVADSLGAERTRNIGPLAVALFLFILISNYIDLLPIPRADAPTSDLNTTAGLALMVFFLVHALGIRRHGVIGYFKHTFSFPALAPITVIEEVSKPLTLALRLFGNIFAGEVLIIVFGVLLTHLFVVFSLPLPYIFALGLGLFVGAIQAFIFSVLTVSYIGIATASEGH